MFKPINFSKEQIADFHNRGCDMRLGYEDCVMLGIALCAEREQALRYLNSREDPACDCAHCTAARERVKAIGGALDTLKAGIMAVWPELHEEACQRRADGRAYADDAKRHAAELISRITGEEVSPEDIEAIHVGSLDELDAELSRFSPVAGHG